MVKALRRFGGAKSRRRGNAMGTEQMIAPRPARSMFGPGALHSGVDPRKLAELASLVVAGSNRESITVTVPFTGEPLGRIPRCTEADVEQAIRRARAVQEAWAEVPLDERAAFLLKFHDLVLARREEALDII